MAGRDHQCRFHVCLGQGLTIGHAHTQLGPVTEAALMGKTG